MIVVMKQSATEEDVRRVRDRIEKAGGICEVHHPAEVLVSAYGCDTECIEELTAMGGVSQARLESAGPWLVSRERQKEDTVVEVMGRFVRWTKRRRVCSPLWVWQTVSTHSSQCSGCP